jgi:hypothetical protein
MPNKNPAQGRVIAKVVLFTDNTLGLIFMPINASGFLLLDPPLDPVWVAREKSTD